MDCMSFRKSAESAWKRNKDVTVQTCSTTPEPSKKHWDAAHLGVHVRSWHSHSSHLLHVGSPKPSKRRPPHLKRHSRQGSYRLTRSDSLTREPKWRLWKRTHRSQRIRGWKKSSPWHHSCHGIGWCQQRHRFRLIGNHPWRQTARFQVLARAGYGQHSDKTCRQVTSV